MTPIALPAMPVAVALLALATGCATTSPSSVAERTYVRPGSEKLKLKTLDVVVFVSGPPRVATEKFEIRGFEPPKLDGPLIIGKEELDTRTAIVADVLSQLKAKGFEVKAHVKSLVTPAAPTPPPPPPPPPPAPVQTSSTSSTAPAQPPPPPPPPPAPPPPQMPQHAVLQDGLTLKAFLDSSTADGVLVVRAVPVDSFFVDVGVGTKIIDTGLGVERVRDYRPEAREGRLLIGQAFLFDRATGVRLWSKQAPGYPAERRITPQHPFLKYGFVGKTTDRVALARAASGAFVPKLLGDFPGARDGDATARAALDEVDAEFEQRAQTFLDSGHFSFEIGGGWGIEPSQLELAFFGEEQNPLGSGALTPSGVPRIVPRVAYLSRGSWNWQFAVPIGLIPGDFGRVYYADGAPGDDNQAASVQVNGALTYGLEFQGGPAFRLSPNLFVVTRAGVFLEVWDFDALPGSAVANDLRARLGAIFGSDAIYMLGDDGGLFGRLGVDGRLGADTNGPFILGFALTAGVGFLL